VKWGDWRETCKLRQGRRKLKLRLYVSCLSDEVTDRHTYIHTQTDKTDSVSVSVTGHDSQTDRVNIMSISGTSKTQNSGCKATDQWSLYPSCHYQLGCLVEHWLQWSGGNMLWHVRNCPILLLLSQWVWTVQIYLHFRPRQVKWISAVVWWQSLIQSGIYGSLRYVLYVLYDLS